MSTLYKSVAFNLATTSVTTLYTCPIETETLIKTIQVTNYTTSGNVDLVVFINKSGTDYDITHQILSSKDSINALDGILVAEAGDVIKIQAGASNSISGAMSFVEVRSDTKNPI
jgi:hypothetical protein